MKKYVVDDEGRSRVLEGLFEFGVVKRDLVFLPWNTFKLRNVTTLIFSEVARDKTRSLLADANIEPRVDCIEAL